jgi:hypothetical protein
MQCPLLAHTIALTERLTLLRQRKLVGATANIMRSAGKLLM